MNPRHDPIAIGARALLKDYEARERGEDAAARPKPPSAAPQPHQAPGPASAAGNTDCVIEDGIPIPPVTRSGTGIRQKVREMKIGQSLAVPFVKRHTLTSAATKVAATEPGRRSFTARTVIEKGVKKCRVWRVI